MSVIVPARDAGRCIGACIDGLMIAGFAPAEITVVDDGSHDDTAQIARSRGVGLLQHATPRGAAAARNAGAAATSGNVIVFVDADVVVAPEARCEIAEFFRDNVDYAAMFGAYDAAPAASGSVSRIRNLLHRHVHLENAGDATTFWSGCGAVRRATFDAVGGFDSNLRMMEDVALGMTMHAQGHRVRLVPSLQGKHLKRWTLASMARADLFDRAIPWARLLQSAPARMSETTLNVSPAGRLSVGSVALSLFGVMAVPFAPVTGTALAFLAVGGLILANAAFLGRLRTEGRAGDRMVAIPVLWVHYFCAGAGFGWVIFQSLLRCTDAR